MSKDVEPTAGSAVILTSHMLSIPLSGTRYYISAIALVCPTGLHTRRSLSSSCYRASPQGLCFEGKIYLAYITIMASFGLRPCQDYTMKKVSNSLHYAENLEHKTVYTAQKYYHLFTFVTPRSLEKKGNTASDNDQEHAC